MEKIQTSLNIGFQNINKLISKQTEKSKDELFIGAINKSDIIGLAEVKCDLNKAKFEKLYEKGLNIYHLNVQSTNGLNLTKSILALIRIFMYVLHIFHRSTRHFVWTRMLTF